ncbi:histidine kinase [Nonomuraea sp. NPDC049709]|uniref:sensor histidine kinase n=1 Tax=Nonomuraea sp. NPDC049709 TaxID=3154736 RepID=UPI00342C0B7F
MAHVRESGKPLREALADFLDAERSALLAAYVAGLESMSSPLIGDPESRPQLLAHADLTITDVMRSLRLGHPTIDEGYKLLAWDIGKTRAESRLHPRASLQAATCLADVTMNAAADYLSEHACGRELLVLVMRAVTESVIMRVHEASLAYSSQLLHDINAAHVDERRRIARELHDRVGSGLGVAHHQLELAEVYRTNPANAMNRVTLAHEAVQNAMLSTRSIVSDLRMDEQVHNLEKELTTLLETIAPDGVIMRLRVNGDEAWASRQVLAETFLIIREAVRNALAHGTPSMVLISVNIAPSQLHAMVEDDGGGFDLARARRSSGMGLTSMRERAELIGGRLMLTPVVNRGTYMELVVPLSEHRDG